MTGKTHCVRAPHPPPSVVLPRNRPCMWVRRGRQAGEDVGADVEWEGMADLRGMVARVGVGFRAKDCLVWFEFECREVVVR